LKAYNITIQATDIPVFFIQLIGDSKTLVERQAFHLFYHKYPDAKVTNIFTELDQRKCFT